MQEAGDPLHLVRLQDVRSGGGQRPEDQHRADEHGSLRAKAIVSQRVPAMKSTAASAAP